MAFNNYLMELMAEDTVLRTVLPTIFLKNTDQKGRGNELYYLSLSWLVKLIIVRYYRPIKLYVLL